jgi:hypothetical protein
MELVPFQPEHLAGIDPPAMTPGQLEFFCHRYRARGPAWTGLEAGRVVGCGGVVVTGEVGTAWAIIGRPAPAVAIHRAALWALEKARTDAALRRIEASARTDWERAGRWLRRLGFRPAGVQGEYRRYVR